MEEKIEGLLPGKITDYRADLISIVLNLKLKKITKTITEKNIRVEFSEKCWI